ncbi:MAG TPA: hypothetical protein VK735_18215 [Pseudonocardia sp.]|uniref:hypothetical protein n=1 Tax=Pseudonocardia sp. TaxID=60912 RepID=UPI002C9085A2|nr:hypothetical protein [Pseudonocardia sp.]HTF49380.1 hypothetical protein [Pseudonocardia sp.]
MKNPLGIDLTPMAEGATATHELFMAYVGGWTMAGERDRQGARLMLDNFAPQPYPLEASYDDLPWAFVLGWSRDKLGVLGVLVYLPESSGAIEWNANQCRFRVADTRSVVQIPQRAPHAGSTSGSAPRRRGPT